MKTAMMNDLFEVLSEEDQTSVLDYIQFLADREGKRKEERAQRIFDEVAEILDGDTGWASEEEMIADLAEFRRKRMAGNDNTD